MLKRETGGGDNTWARFCDTCRSAACTVYCRTDSAYLCTACDSQIHAANRVASRHERVWVCQACERAPAAFLCKADAASLCAACDSDIHSANPLARRHHRVPILPIPHGAQYDPNGSHGAGLFLGQDGDGTLDEEEEEDDGEDDDEAASWLLLDPVKHNNTTTTDNSVDNTDQGNGLMFGGEADDYLDLIEYNSSADQFPSGPYNQQKYSLPRKNYAGDSVVPVQCRGVSITKDILQQQQHQHHQQNFHLSLGYEPSKATGSCNGSLCHSVSVSSMDIGIVPESTIMDASISPKGTIDLFSGPSVQMPNQLSPVDREARVLRYREKKKTRKFEKTIRYASRKAYAETRPRIKGRFAKRTDIEIEVDQMFSTTIMTENGYGIVPSF